MLNTRGVTASSFPQASPGETSLIRVLSKRNLEMVFPEKTLG
jgi:hypothetical protein